MRGCSDPIEEQVVLSIKFYRSETLVGLTGFGFLDRMKMALY
jgi:hypothetical protein